ncbi:MAG: hypothetical protein Ct9H300mP5_4190 [Candidatus Pelagibacterales bacterium]|nr:MAG: hypothetical protein Ct9H300mP5_4190 [Pelagibacterales bacterium]
MKLLKGLKSRPCLYSGRANLVWHYYKGLRITEKIALSIGDIFVLNHVQGFSTKITAYLLYHEPIQFHFLLQKF